MSHLVSEFRNELAFADNLWDVDLIVHRNRKPLSVDIADSVYSFWKARGVLRGLLGRYVSRIPFVKARLEAETAISRVRELCEDREQDEVSGFVRTIDKGVVAGGVPHSTEIFDEARGVLVEEFINPYATSAGPGPPGNWRDSSNKIRAKVLGPYMRYVVNELIAHFDPLDRATSVGRAAMRKYAYKLMLDHGVRKHDIAKHLDRVVAAAVAKVDAAEQIRQHDVFLHGNGVRRV